MVEKVVKNNFFHDSSRFGGPNGIIKMVEKVVKNNFFHDLGLQNGLSRGKSWF